MRMLGFIFIYLLFGILIMGGIIVFFIGELILGFMDWMINVLNSLLGVVKVLLGVFFGVMIFFDMGGFVNKVVVMFV